ncbi:MAG: S26 family signal peptidase [Bacteroidales bacterium]|nr:S26 family signal peptidase [Candidatus Liminaster caballi]
MTLGDKIKCALWVTVVLLFCLWMSSGWPLLIVPFVVDLYWTHYIPWTWWRGLENRFLREIMSWIDAIVFAVVAVWILQAFFFQNFQIPTTSLEKTMLAGDYLLVSKFNYGPRIPMTPLSLPLFQHTIAIGNTNLGKSYIAKPQLPYHRMPGLSQIKRNDIVVFNYPLGDSIMTKSPEDDYYQVRDYLMKGRGMSREEFERMVGPVFERPVDRRENYVKRCIGLPGEKIQIIDRQVYIDGTAIDNPEYMQHRYFVYTTGSTIPVAYWRSLGIYTQGNGSTVNPDVYELLDRVYADGSRSYELTEAVRAFGIEPDSVTGKYNHLYSVIMTEEKAAKVAQKKDVAWVQLPAPELEGYAGIFPSSPLFRWKANNFGPLWIPKAGQSIELNPETEALYGRCIRTYEGNKLQQTADGQYLLNGEAATSYTFKMDYYWMMGDNRDNSADSRYWGFVPEDHIVGTPLFIWISIDQETGSFRWDRLFKSVKGI